MTKPINLRRIAAAGLAALLSLALSACFVLPGKFAETLDIRKDGTFSYAYKGEIVVLGLTKLMQMAQGAGGPAAEEYVPSPCYAAKTGRERPCTKAEEAKQKADWEEAAKAHAEARKKTDAQMAAFMGGLDPNNPKSGEELAERLRKQAGFKSVTYKGDGVYEIDFQIAGRLDHDFIFPTIERLPSIMPFIAVNLRSDASVRITSPIMAQASAGGLNAMGLSGLASGAGASGTADHAADAAAQDKPGEGKADEAAADLAKLPFPLTDGTFTLTTDAEILANNTEDGPVAIPTGKRLEWKLNVRNPNAPMALLQLAR